VSSSRVREPHRPRTRHITKRANRTTHLDGDEDSAGVARGVDDAGRESHHVSDGDGLQEHGLVDAQRHQRRAAHEEGGRCV